MAEVAHEDVDPTLIVRSRRNTSGILILASLLRALALLRLLGIFYAIVLSLTYASASARRLVTSQLT